MASGIRHNRHGVDKRGCCIFLYFFSHTALETRTETKTTTGKDSLIEEPSTKDAPSNPLRRFVYEALHLFVCVFLLFFFFSPACFSLNSVYTRDWRQVVCISPEEWVPFFSAIILVIVVGVVFPPSKTFFFFFLFKDEEGLLRLPACPEYLVAPLFFNSFANPRLAVVASSSLVGERTGRVIGREEEDRFVFERPFVSRRVRDQLDVSPLLPPLLSWQHRTSLWNVRAQALDSTVMIRVHVAS